MLAMISVMSIDDLDFAEIIKSGDIVVCGQATSEPRTLTEALVAQEPCIMGNRKDKRWQDFISKNSR